MMYSNYIYTVLLTVFSMVHMVYLVQRGTWGAADSQQVGDVQVRPQHSQNLRLRHQSGLSAAPCWPDSVMTRDTV